MKRLASATVNTAAAIEILVQAYSARFRTCARSRRPPPRANRPRSARCRAAEEATADLGRLDPCPYPCRRASGRVPVVAGPVGVEPSSPAPLRGITSDSARKGWTAYPPHRPRRPSRSRWWRRPWSRSGPTGGPAHPRVVRAVLVQHHAAKRTARIARAGDAPRRGGAPYAPTPPARSGLRSSCSCARRSCSATSFSWKCLIS